MQVFESTLKSLQTAATGGAAAPLPSRGGVSEGRGGVCKYLVVKNIQTTPLLLPVRAGFKRGAAAHR